MKRTPQMRRLFTFLVVLFLVLACISFFTAFRSISSDAARSTSRRL